MNQAKVDFVQSKHSEFFEKAAEEYFATFSLEGSDTDRADFFELWKSQTLALVLSNGKAVLSSLAASERMDKVAGIMDQYDDALSELAK